MSIIPTIMTVDDSQMMRKAISRVLRRYKCRIVEAEDGAVGLTLTVTEKPDLILLDYNMPVMDGFEMLKHLRANPATKATKVIMLTANSSHEFIKEAVALGVRDYIVKPFEDNAFIAKVMRQVNLSSI